MPTLYTKISPHAAVARGLLSVYGVVVPILVLSVIAPVGVLAFFSGAGSSPAALGAALIAFVALWCLAWLAWSLRVPYWRLWAYRRVDDLAALKRQAAAAGPIWPDNHRFWPMARLFKLFEKTEIVPPALRAELGRLEREFEDRRSGAA